MHTYNLSPLSLSLSLFYLSFSSSEDEVYPPEDIPLMTYGCHTHRHLGILSYAYGSFDTWTSLLSHQLFKTFRRVVPKLPRYL